MPFSHHSHSGQFCNHATSSLASILATASAANFHTYAVTEHCPRTDAHLYPEELAAGYDSLRLNALYDAFVIEAVRLRDAYARGETPTSSVVPGQRADFAQDAVPSNSRDPSLPPLRVLVGFEAEWIAGGPSADIAASLLARHAGAIDFFVGSLHFVRGVPIDFDRATYLKAREVCGGDDASLFAAYFDEQYEMLLALKPRVVGHFDLVRLFSDAPDKEWEVGSTLWEKVVRNLESIAGYGGLLELNASALRKGLEQPYPRREVCEAFERLGGGFVLSDDCHAVGHVGTNYSKLLAFVKEIGLARVSYLHREENGEVVTKSMSVAELEHMEYWKTA